jgi:ribosome-associated protein
VISTRLASTAADRERALDVWKAARAAQGRRPNREVVTRVEQKAANGLLLLAEEESDVVGLGLAEAGTDDPELLHIEMVIVHPSQQGRGLGAQIVEALADVGWERGFRHAEVWCTAPGFYEAAGFERSGQVKESGSVHLVAELEAPLREVPVSGEIRLGQFLKLAELVETGAEAKALIADGAVLVNDEVENRRGRQLADGDVVRANDRAARLVVSP